MGIGALTRLGAVTRSSCGVREGARFDAAASFIDCYLQAKKGPRIDHLLTPLPLQKAPHPMATICTERLLTHGHQQLPPLDQSS
jgi:hypothetical protein